MILFTAGDALAIRISPGICWPRWSCKVLRHALRGDFQPVFLPLVVRQARQHQRETFPEYLGAFEEWLQTVSEKLGFDARRP